MSTEIDTTPDEFSSACAHCECADRYGMARGRVYCWADHAECADQAVCGRIADRTDARLLTQAVRR